MLNNTGERYLSFIDPMITGAEIHYEHLHRYAFASQFVKDKYVLDLASGEGYGSYLLSSDASGVVGIEIDKDAIAHSRARYSRTNLEFKHGSILKIPIDGSKIFDVIVCFEALEHVEDHDRLFSEVKRLLKNDGIFIISTPNKMMYSDEANYHNPFHLKELYFEDFKNILLRYFSYEYMYGQRVFTGSNIWGLSSKSESYCNEFVIEKEDSNFAFKSIMDKVPMYFISIASDIPIDEVLDKTSYLIDKSNILTVRRDDQIASLSNQLQQANAHASSLCSQLQQANAHASSLEYEIAEIRESLIWQLTMKFHNGFVERVVPQGSWRRSCYDLGLKGSRILANDGWDSFRIHLQMYINSKLFNKSGYEKLISKLEPTKAEIDAIRKECGDFKYRPKISIIIPVWNTNENWIKSAINSVLNQIYSNWELCIVDDASTELYIKEILDNYRKRDYRIKVRYLSENLGISGASNEAISLATGEYIGFLDHDDELIPSALFQVVKVLNENHAIDFIYSDEISTTENGRPRYALFRPNFSIDYILSHCYIVHFSVIRSDIIRKIGGFRKEFKISQDYDLFLRVISETKNIYHIQKILYKWREHYSSSGHIYKSRVAEFSKRAIQDFLDREEINGIALETEHFNYFRVKRFIKGNPKISIIITVKDQLDSLGKCISSIKDKSLYSNYEILIVDKIGEEDIKLGLESSVNNLEDKDFNISYFKSNNLAAEYSQGEHLLFLENDMEVISPDWINSMLEHSQREEVGCVGAKLLYPNNRIQHAGIVLGEGQEKYIYENWHHKNIGYMGHLISIRNYSAITGACMMVKKNVFEEIGGFDEGFEVSFMDLDFCLKVQKRGYLNVFTPYAELYHNDLSSDSAITSNILYQEDKQHFTERWQDLLYKNDPFYNPNLPIKDNNFLSYVYFG